MSCAARELDRLQELAGVGAGHQAVTPEDIERVSDQNLKMVLGHMDFESLGAHEGARLIMELEMLWTAHMRPPTPHEHILGYRIVEGASKEVETSLTRLGIQIPARPVVGTLPSLDVSARELVCRNADGGAEFLVVLDMGVFTFVNLYAKIVPQAAMLDPTKVTAMEPEAVRRRAHDVLRAFIDLLRAFLIDHDARSASQYDIDHEFYRAYQHILSAIESFIVGHEYGHVLAQHLNEQADGLTELSTSFDREFEADAWALAIVLASEIPITYVVMGVDSYFVALNVLEKARPRWARQVQESHPPANERRERLRVMIGDLTDATNDAESGLPALAADAWRLRCSSSTDTEVKAVAFAALEDANIVKRVVEGAWTTIRPIFEE